MVSIGVCMDLFSLASTYSSFGHHRTGSDSQRVTEDRLLGYLKNKADSVEFFCFDYQHFEAATECFLNGRPIPSIALYYEAVDELQGKNNIETAAVSIDIDEHEAYDKIQSLVKHSKQINCDGLVIATRCTNDSLYAFNVNPLLNDSLPVILIPGHEFKNLSEQEISVDYSASIGQRTAKNIVAKFGRDSSRSSIVITTPMSGWFECAGERGTGVALAITLAEQLSNTCPVKLVLTSGHELGYLGGFEYTAALANPPAFVIHLGSSLATFDSSIEAWSNIDGAVFDDMNKILRKHDIPLNKVGIPSRRSDWVGEAECWAHLNCPMLSIAGVHALFHTPEDQIELATNEDSLATAFKFLCELATIVETDLYAC